MSMTKEEASEILKMTAEASSKVCDQVLGSVDRVNSTQDRLFELGTKMINAGKFEEALLSSCNTIATSIEIQRELLTGIFRMQGLILATIGALDHED